MKKVIIVLIFCGLFTGVFIGVNSFSLPEKISEKSKVFNESILQEGDVIFQTSNYGQSWAVQKATNSKYSHVGMLFKEQGKWMVYEAVQPVQKISLADFISHGDQKHFTISRFKSDEQLSKEKIEKMKAFFNQLEGKNYDIYFEWSDKTWYCSELVWKMYDHVGIKISEYERFGQYNLEDPAVKEIINERFQNGVKLDETVITPRGIYESPYMIEVYTNY